MDANKLQKFERCLRLTESSNDHEALTALRIAQGMCKTFSLNFSDYILKNKSTQSNTTEFQKLRSELSALKAQYSKLNEQNTSLFNENFSLRNKLHKQETKKNTKKSENDLSSELKNLKKKYQQLKEDYDELSDEQDYYINKIQIIDKIFGGDDKDKEQSLIEMVRGFIKDKDITVCSSEWNSSTKLYNSFIDTCYDVKVTSSKKFSQIFSSLLKIKPVKGGELKNLMGFNVCEYGIYG